ncbi:MAG: hypothetical protein CFH19_00476 [Alphaproteobacteria bacterium MarineAlpha5_Bin9]|nr:MAG: hypothetical protein CFH19_00476 [Alphaproteobacteria bacterium MarineAlpha5_Bin9]|tara:strand:+ start:341 stop:1567 length:1227 start_codon:yes stop_codon:yes gene_type:complete
MIDLKPFKGFLPYKEPPENLIAPSTDYLSEDKLDYLFKDNWNYINILNPQVENDNTALFAKNYFQKMKKYEIIKKDNNLSFYLYKINHKSHIQLGFIALANIDSFIHNYIKSHELIYENRAQERADQMLNLHAQIGPIYVAYNDIINLDNFLIETSNSKPHFHFSSFDGSIHSLWILNDKNKKEKFSELINQIETLYICDGHHRISAMKKIYEFQHEHPNKKNNLNKYFMIAAFPKTKTKIYDYNRVIKDLNGLDLNNFLNLLSSNFVIKESNNPYLPKKSRNFGMYHNKKWYHLFFKNEHLLDNNDILSKLDINIINNFCLKNLLGIENANTDDRIRFIAGCHGLIALEKKVDNNTNSIAFSIFPTQIDDVIDIAENNLTMPPKSTWFEPKPLDGMVVYDFGENNYE